MEDYTTSLLTVHLSRKQIFIVPTSQGLLYGGLLLVMLVGSINYNSSLGHLLTFLLASLGLTTMISTYRNLVGLSVGKGAASPVYAGQTAHFPILLQNFGRAPHYALRVGFPTDQLVATDVPADATAWLTAAAPTSARGYLCPGPITLCTTFPLGLFRAWANVDLDLRCVVYPRPEGTSPLPHSSSSSEASRATERRDEDFAGLQEYRPGDSPRRICWKAFARSDEVLVKHFAAGRQDELWLDWDMLSGDTEQRLSALCRWVLQAEAASTRYGLRLPGIMVSPNLGEVHGSRCLRVLALFDSPVGR